VTTNQDKKELLFSVTRKDCEWNYHHGSGAGGQKRNKTQNAVRVYHPPSGARGQAQESRSLKENEKLAFERMANTKEFSKWVKLEAARVTGQLQKIEEKVDQMMANETKTEIFKDGKWEILDTPV
jgi:protein subunit release factor B